MPFKKTGNNEFTGPSGKKFTKAQVRKYHAGDGFETEGKKKLRIKPRRKRKGE
jgi:hypothetical protein